MKSYKDIDSYIANYPKETQKLLKELRMVIHKIVPKATETISYGIPTFDLNNHHLVHFAAYKHHIGFYPGAAGIAVFKKELAKYPTSKGTVQFQLDKPLPLGLITKIVEFCVAQNIKRYGHKVK